MCEGQYDFGFENGREYGREEGVELAIAELDTVIDGFDHEANQELRTAYQYLMVARNKLVILKEDI